MLNKLKEVYRAVADHEKGTAVVTVSAPVADEALRAAVEAQDYNVVGVE